MDFAPVGMARHVPGTRTIGGAILSSLPTRYRAGLVAGNLSGQLLLWLPYTLSIN